MAGLWPRRLLSAHGGRRAYVCGVDVYMKCQLAEIFWPHIRQTCAVPARVLTPLAPGAVTRADAMVAAYVKPALPLAGYLLDW